MKIYLRGYYGYKNFGDELLLLGLLPYLEKRYASTHICIQTPDKTFLRSWIQKNEKLLKLLGYSGRITYINRIPFFPERSSLLAIGGGEVLTDARGFPYNGRNYLFQNICRFLFGTTVFLGGVGTVKRFTTSLLYRLLFSLSKECVVRDPNSYAVASTYTKRLVQYHDFAYDVLANLDVLDASENSGIAQDSYAIVNINRHILTSVKLTEIRAYFTFSGKLDPSLSQLYFVPASVGTDDADSDLYNLFLDDFPGIEMYDWTLYSLKETVFFLLGSKKSLATRLHIALIFAYYQKPFKALVYQEKVQRMLDSVDGFRQKFSTD